jgi:hypothetical protein
MTFAERLSGIPGIILKKRFFVKCFKTFNCFQKSFTAHPPFEQVCGVASSAKQGLALFCYLDHHYH